MSALAGAGAVLLFAAAALLVGERPSFETGGSELGAYLEDNRTRVQAACALFAVAVPLFVVFLAAALGPARESAAPGARRTAAVALVCGAMFLTLFLADVTTMAVSALRTESMTADPELAGVLRDFELLAMGMAAPLVAGMLGAFAVLALRYDALSPRWLGLLAAVAAPLYALRTGTLFTDTGAFAADGLLGINVPVAALLGWVLTASLTLGLHRAPADVLAAAGTCLAGALGLALGSPSAAAATTVPGPHDGREVMMVANAEGGTVSVVDARTFRVLRELNVLPDGPDAALGQDDPGQALIRQRMVEAAGGANYAQDQDISPDGRTLYVSRGHRGDVAAFDLAEGTMLWKLAIPGFRSDHMTISRDGRRLYVSALTENVVVEVNTETRQVTRSAGAGQWPHDNHLSPDGRRLYNGSIGNIIAPEEARRTTPPPPYQLTVFDTGELRPQRTYAFDRGVRPIVIAEDESRMWAQLSGLHGLIEFDLETAAITRQLELPVDPGVTEADYDFEAPHHGLAISPGERTLCAAGRASDYVALVSTARLRPVAIIEVDDAPGWAATGPDGRHCFVANTRADSVSVISYRGRREVGRIAAGDGPKQIEAARIPEEVLCAAPGVPGCSRRVRLARRCLGRRGLRLSLRGDVAAVRRAVFRVGKRRLRADALPPFARRISRRGLARADARRLRVTVRFAGERRRLSRALPRCARAA